MISKLPEQSVSWAKQSLHEVWACPKGNWLWHCGHLSSGSWLLMLTPPVFCWLSSIIDRAKAIAADISSFGRISLSRNDSIRSAVENSWAQRFEIKANTPIFYCKVVVRKIKTDSELPPPVFCRLLILEIKEMNTELREAISTADSWALSASRLLIFCWRFDISLRLATSVKISLNSMKDSNYNFWWHLWTWVVNFTNKECMWPPSESIVRTAVRISASWSFISLSASASYFSFPRRWSSPSACEFVEPLIDSSLPAGSACAPSLAEDVGFSFLSDCGLFCANISLSYTDSWCAGKLKAAAWLLPNCCSSNWTSFASFYVFEKSNYGTYCFTSSAGAAKPKNAFLWSTTGFTVVEKPSSAKRSIFV